MMTEKQAWKMILPFVASQDEKKIPTDLRKENSYLFNEKIYRIF